MNVQPRFPSCKPRAGMYESFFLRTVSPERALGAWIRYTVHKPPKAPPRGSLWCTVFDGGQPPFMHKRTTAELAVPAGGWIEIGGDSHLSASVAEGACGPARWSLALTQADAPLDHFKQAWLYRAPLPRTKLTSPFPSVLLDGTIELPDRTLELDGWRGMVGHNWGAEHAERWIWLYGCGFREGPADWIDVALGRVLLGSRLTPWVANGAVSLKGRRWRVGGLLARGVAVAERPGRCTLALPGEEGLAVEAHIDAPLSGTAGWRYADPDGGEHDVLNCSVAALALNVRIPGQAAHALHTEHGGVYELGMRERSHGVPIAPFPD